MKIINPRAEIVSKIDTDYVMSLLELAGRVCYKSEDFITDSSSEKFIGGILKRGHESVVEHFNITVRFVVDRGISHEIVRHRIASFSQESTRYCNYSKDKFNKEITVIKPVVLNEGEEAYDIWYNSCKDAEESYFKMLGSGCSPQIARSVLPTSLKTELLMTANLREWRHFFELRTSDKSHPQIVKVSRELLAQFKEKLPVLFSDIETL